MKKVLALVIGLGLIFGTSIAVWGNDTDTPLRPSSMKPSVVTLVSK